MKEIQISSPAFKSGDWIPDRHSGFGDDISPELHIDGIDEKGKSLIILLADARHPLFPNYSHWVAWNIPSLSIIPENIPKGAVIESPIHIEQGMAYGKHYYRGPKPPMNWNHEYHFTVYVLDTVLSISTDSNREDVLEAAENHILQQGILIGKYQRKHK